MHARANAPGGQFPSGPGRGRMRDERAVRSADGAQLGAFPDQGIVMAWIKTISDEQADGAVKQQFDAARARAGRVFNVVRVQALNPPVLAASIGLYRALMFGSSELARALRELLAVVVSRTNACHY